MPRIHCPLCCCLGKVRKRGHKRNPYIEFLKEYIGNHKQQNLPMNALFVRAGKVWHTLTLNQKQSYCSNSLRKTMKNQDLEKSQSSSRKCRGKSKSTHKSTHSLKSTEKRAAYCKPVDLTASQTTHSRSSTPKFCFNRESSKTRGKSRPRRSSRIKRGQSKRKHGFHVRQSSNEKRSGSDEKRTPLSRQSKSSDESRVISRTCSRSSRHRFQRKSSPNKKREHSQGSSGSRTSKESRSSRDKFKGLMKKSFRLTNQSQFVDFNSNLTQVIWKSSQKTRRSQSRSVKSKNLDSICEKAMRRLQKQTGTKGQDKQNEKNKLYCKHLKDKLGIRDPLKQQDPMCSIVEKRINSESKLSKRHSLKSSSGSSIKRTHFKKCSRLKVSRSLSKRPRKKIKSKTASCLSLKNSDSETQFNRNSDHKVLAGFEASSDESSSFCCCDKH